MEHLGLQDLSMATARQGSTAGFGNIKQAALGSGGWSNHIVNKCYRRIYWRNNSVKC